MSQDQFTLTPQDVRAQDFAKSMRGYDRLEVEAFRGRVADELERLLRERAQLDERVRNAQEQLRAFRERERARNDALLAAQPLRHDAQARPMNIGARRGRAFGLAFALGSRVADGDEHPRFGRLVGLGSGNEAGSSLGEQVARELGRAHAGCRARCRE